MPNELDHPRRQALQTLMGGGDLAENLRRAELGAAGLPWLAVVFYGLGELLARATGTPLPRVGGAIGGLGTAGYYLVGRPLLDIASRITGRDRERSGR